MKLYIYIVTVLLGISSATAHLEAQTSLVLLSPAKDTIYPSITNAIVLKAKVSAPSFTNLRVNFYVNNTLLNNYRIKVSSDSTVSCLLRISTAEKELTHKIWAIVEDSTTNYSSDTVNISFSNIQLTPGWTVNPTTVTHTIYINRDKPPIINGSPLQFGDLIGVFYDSAGREACGGFTDWRGVNTFITAYGKTQTKTGFAEKEPFRFKIWRFAQNCTSYQIESIAFNSDTGAYFTENGVSYLERLVATPYDFNYITPNNKGICPTATTIAPNYTPFDIECISQTEVAFTDNKGTINVNESKAGQHIIYAMSAYCLRKQTDTVTIFPKQILFDTKQVNTCKDTFTIVPTAIGSAYLWNDQSTNSSLKVTRSGNYQLRLTDTNGCITTDTIQIQIAPLQFPPAIVTVENATCLRGGSILIQDTNWHTDKPISYILDNTHNLQIASESPSFFDVPIGNYSLTAYNANGCKAMYPQKINIIKTGICEGNVFTPNGDGLADTYYIPMQGTAKIYNHLGLLVREISLPTEWDGTDSSGNPVSMGVYLIVCQDKEMSVTLIR
jgi:hypothetical protein